MKQHHERTLHALLAHPLHHNLRMDDVEALLLHLGIHIDHRSDHRINLQAPSGARVVLHAASGKHHPFLNEDGILRIRRFLKQEGITPEHPIADEAHPRGEQAKRLVVHVDHRSALLWWLEGDDVHKSTLQPHSLWSSHQRLSHRHDRDVAGQRAPVDFEFLNEISHAILQADRVLLLGHGCGESNTSLLLRKYIEHHFPNAVDRLEFKRIKASRYTDAEILELAFQNYKNS